MKNVRYCSLCVRSPEPALAAVHGRSALDHPEPSCHRQEGQLRPSTIRPTIFTAASLDNRASDINNLLDGIGNGVQVLQAANTGITSLQKLVDTAKSIANQVLQTSVGYSTKANVDVTGTGTGTRHDVPRPTSTPASSAGSVITFKTATGTLAVTIGSTFATGSGTATVKTLDQLNNVLVSNGVAVNASIVLDGRHADLHLDQRRSQPDHHRRRAPLRPARVSISRHTTATVGTVNAAVADAASQTTRANLVTQYNDILHADHHDCAGRFVQRCQPAER